MPVFVESVPNLKQRINQLQVQHTAALEKLYEDQAARYLDDALDRYLAQDDVADDDGYVKDIQVYFFSNRFRDQF